MEEYYSDCGDCYDLNIYLMQKLKKKISIYGSLSNPLVNGKYYGLADNTYRGDYQTIQNGMQFFAKFNKEAFLRIGVGKSYSRQVSDGEKLAALSDLCLVLSEKYGTPDVFYTTKDDDEEAMTIQWTFKNLELDHERLEYGEYFDDAEVDKLIFMDNTKPIVTDELSAQIGLPVEMYPLVAANLADFVKYKNGQVKEDSLKLVLTPPEDK